MMYNVKPRSLQDCFELFAELPRVINDLEAIRVITQAALRDFADHHTAYLELRSTPKCLMYDFRQHNSPSTTIDGSDSSPQPLSQLCTKQEYVETILGVMQEFEKQELARYERESTGNNHSLPRLPMVCRFIISVDRSQSLDDAVANIDLAIRMQRTSDYVVGVDLGGNPTQRHFSDFCSLLQKARRAGLAVTIHCAELPCGDRSHPAAYAEAAAVLEFRPDRLGHALLLPSALLQRLHELQIPVETCPTSNVMTLELHHHQHHPDDDDDNNNDNDTDCNNHSTKNEGSSSGSRRRHGNLVGGLKRNETLRHWIEQRHPMAVCTDDPGVFDTNATRELWLLATTFHWSNEHLATAIVLPSLRYAFDQKNIVQQQVYERIRMRVDTVLHRRLTAVHSPLTPTTMT